MIDDSINTLFLLQLLMSHSVNVRARDLQQTTTCSSTFAMTDFLPLLSHREEKITHKGVTWEACTAPGVFPLRFITAAPSRQSSCITLSSSKGGRSVRANSPNGARSVIINQTFSRKCQILVLVFISAALLLRRRVMWEDFPAAEMKMHRNHRNS